jgi:non-homologous end joining protein Ku
VEAVLLLHDLHFPEQVRACPRAAPAPAAAPKEELHLAGQLIDAASGVVDWSRYRDQAAQELNALVEAHLAGQPAAVTTAPVLPPLLQALRDSVSAATTESPSQAKATRPLATVPTPRSRKRRTA